MGEDAPSFTSVIETGVSQEAHRGLEMCEKLKRGLNPVKVHGGLVNCSTLGKKLPLLLEAY